MTHITDYAGVWQRKVLQTPTLSDHRTTVFWMQVGAHHIDLRIPPIRPARNVETLDSYTTDELMLIARSEGFSGRTVVTGYICQWCRKFDFQPASQFHDIATMQFENPDTLHETGIEQAYYERWERLAHSLGDVVVACTRVADAWGILRRAVWMRSGNYAALMRPRRVPHFKAATFAQPFTDMPRETLLGWLDMEISFGVMLSADHWKITHSLWPFREGKVLEVPKTGSMKPTSWQEMNDARKITKPPINRIGDSEGCQLCP